VELSLGGSELSEPDFAHEVKEALTALGARFLGRVEDPKSFYAGIDLLLVPSRQDPLPTVIVEAGLSGLPVVASSAGGIPEMITEGGNGYFAETEEEYVRAIERARDPARWRELSREARRLAESRYDVAKLTLELESHYEAARAGARR
jgi:glycosyltransferase involved in cell wall biosynthesis